MAKKTFTTAYNRTSESIKDCSVIKFTHPSKVKESLGYATDINQIYDNYCKTGKLPLNGQQPIYDENFIKLDSLIEAEKIVTEANEYFVGLPAKIKNQYGNNLQKFIKALNNCDEFLVKEGLLHLPSPEPVPENIKTPDVEPTVPQKPSTSDVQNPSTSDVNTATTD